MSIQDQKKRVPVYSGDGNRLIEFCDHARALRLSGHPNVEIVRVKRSDEIVRLIIRATVMDEGASVASRKQDSRVTTYREVIDTPSHRGHLIQHKQGWVDEWPDIAARERAA